MRHSALIINTAAMLMVLIGIASAAGEGARGASFLKLGPGARVLGMGGAGAALAVDADAVFWNPAGLAALNEKRSAAGSYATNFSGLWQGTLALAGRLPEKPGFMGFGIHYVRVNDIDKISQTGGDPQFRLNDRDFALTTAYAYEFQAVEGFSLGTGIKFIRESRGGADENSFAVDFGGAYRLSEGINLGASLQNLGAGMGVDSLPPVVRLGAAWRLPVKTMTLALEGESWFKERRNYIDIGLEHLFAESSAFRIGYQAGRRQEDGSPTGGLSLGLGFSQGPYEWGYAAVPEGELGLTHRFSVSTEY